MDLKIMFLGPANVGKTSIICRYCNNMFEMDPLSTIGAGFSNINLEIDNNNITLYLWDTAGEERFRSIAPSLIHGAHGLVLVYDITNPNFNETEIYWKMFIDNATVPLTDTLPILLLGNKVDVIKDEFALSNNPEDISDQNCSEFKLDEDSNIKNNVLYEEKMEKIRSVATSWCKDHNIPNVKFVSAKTGENINEAMLAFTKTLIKPTHGKDRIAPIANDDQKKKCC